MNDQVPPEQIIMRHPPFTHLEVQQGNAPGIRVLVIVDKVTGVVRQIPMAANYAEELGHELSAPSVVVPQGAVNGHG